MSTAYVRITGTDKRYGSVRGEISCIMVSQESGDWEVTLDKAQGVTNLTAFNATDGLLIEADVTGAKHSTRKGRVVFLLANIHRISGDAPAAYKSHRWPMKIV